MNGAFVGVRVVSVSDLASGESLGDGRWKPFCGAWQAWRRASEGLSSVEWYPTNPESCDVEALFCSSIGALLRMLALFAFMLRVCSLMLA